MKEKLKSFLSDELKSYLKGSLYLIKTGTMFHHDRILMNQQLIQNLKVFSLRNRHVFCGYYDYFPIFNQKLLCQSVKKFSKTCKNNSEIGYFDLITGQYVRLTETSAWCWQQGSRLHWSQDGQFIIYNDVSNSNYCTHFFDVEKRKILKTIIPALYDMNLSEKIGASLNFSRLQRLRKGYGYDKLPDETILDNAPENDGLFLVDIVNNTSRLVVSLYDLASDVDPNHENQHYLNHICFSPNGAKIMFFHIWTSSSWPGWKTRLCVYRIESDELIFLEETDNVSHYNWINNEELLITGSSLGTKESFYRIYNECTKTYSIVDSEQLHLDGHPTVIKGKKGFISDTYPSKSMIQELFYYDLEQQKRSNLVYLYSDPRLTSEFRCDLHPKVQDKSIVVDTTFQKNKRCVILFQLRDGAFDEKR